MEYKSLFDYIYQASLEYTKSVNRPSKLINWQVEIYVDMCHSGSCIEEGKEWVKK